MTNYDHDLAETECAAPVREEQTDTPPFTEGLIYGVLISSTLWAVAVIWVVI